MNNTQMLAVIIVALVVLGLLYIAAAPKPQHNVVTTSTVNTSTSIFNFSTSTSVVSTIGSITSINTVSNTTGGYMDFVNASILVGINPSSIAISNNSRFVYVLNLGSNTISVISASNNSVLNTIDIPGYATGSIAITPNGKYLYVPVLTAPDTGQSAVMVISTSSYSRVATINLTTLSNPLGIVATPNGQYVYVMNIGASNISVISTSDNQVVGTILDPPDPIQAAITPDSNYLYILNTNGQEISVASTSNNKIKQIINTEQNGAQGSIAITPNGKYAYFNEQEDNYTSVSVIAISNNTVIASLPEIEFNSSVFLGPISSPLGQVAITPDGKYVYVTNSYGFISIYSTSNNTLIGNMRIGNYAGGIAIAPNGKNAYVTDPYVGSVTVIRLTNN